MTIEVSIPGRGIVPVQSTRAAFWSVAVEALGIRKQGHYYYAKVDGSKYRLNYRAILWAGAAILAGVPDWKPYWIQAFRLKRVR